MSIYSVAECDFCHKKDVDGQRIYKCDICDSHSCVNHKMKVLSDSVCLCEDCNNTLNPSEDKEIVILEIKFRYTYRVIGIDGIEKEIIEYWTLKDMEDFNIANLYGNKIKTNIGTFYIEQKVIKKEILVCTNDIFKIDQWFTLWQK